jgi:hypothetical protein
MAEIPRQRFLLLFPVEKVTDRCCCGCTLEVGIFLLSLMGLVMEGILVYILIDEHGGAVLITYNIVKLIPLSILMISLKNKKYSFAICSYYFYIVVFYLNLAMLAFYLIETALSVYYLSENGLWGFVLFKFITFICIMVLFAYFLWIIFSYAKLLKYKEHEVIKGKPQHSIDFSYQNVTTTSSAPAPSHATKK